jgi:hypothetical protein
MVVTYVLESESGMSLRYARWKKLATGRGGGQWGSESRPRAAREGEVAGSKDLFGKRLAPPLVTDAELSRRSNEGPSQLDLFALSNPGDDLDFYLSVLRWLDGKGPRPNLEAWEPRKDEPGWAHEAFRKIALERKKKRLIAALQGKRAAHFKDKSGVSYMIHPAVRPDAPAGYWQLTTFALDGAPWGHRYVSSLAEGVSELVDEIGSVELHESNPPCHSPKRASKALKGVVDSGSRQCYPASEAFYHAVCGQARGFTPVQGKHEGMSHWWVRGPKGKVYDLTARQFQTPVPYDQGRGRGWLTKKPSKRAVALMRKAGLV